MKKKKPKNKTNRHQISKIPDYLKHYMAKQDYGAYTSIDHASWRYIMRVSKQFFKNHAHTKYLTGLNETGITVEQIPRIRDMDKKLRRFGWQVATVTGFIPPSVFLEFLSLSILPIACDIRRLEHLEYSPAPDIVHEAAGHAPIISDQQFATYLNNFGEIARKALFAKEDLDVYEAIKDLSEIKESATATDDEIAKAEQRLSEVSKTVNYTSEATKLARLGWWSTEYGLIKQNNKFKIYGAGLLSSVGESYDFLDDSVTKVPLTIDCVTVNYDITKPQPQLFYVDSFKQLEGVINELAKTLAYKIGGLEALVRAKRSELVVTAELETGLQISGRLTGIFTDKSKDEMGTQEIGKTWTPGVHVGLAEYVHIAQDKVNEVAQKKYGDVIYVQFQGPSQLSFNDRELKGQSARYHKQGYGTPLGYIKGLKKTAADLTRKDLMTLGFEKRKKGRLEFESGVVVEGMLTKVLRKNNKNLVLTFKNCRVHRDSKTFFEPEWGQFDMACGANVLSVFSGAADRHSYVRDTRPQKPKMRGQNSTLTALNRPLVPIYKKVRNLREKKSQSVEGKLKSIFNELKTHYPQDWLLRLELLELATSKTKNTALKEEISQDLDRLSAQNEIIATLISRGRELI